LPKNSSTSRTARVAAGALAALLLAAGAGAGTTMDSLKAFDALPDRTMTLLARFPSMGMDLTGPRDSRIGLLAHEFDAPFKLSLRFSGRPSPTFVLVDPKRRTGFLWWKRVKTVVVGAEEIQAARSGLVPLSPDVVSFLDVSAPATGATGAAKAPGE
jgi:hypothetical protein